MCRGLKISATVETPEPYEKMSNNEIAKGELFGVKEDVEVMITPQSRISSSNLCMNVLVKL